MTQELVFNGARYVVIVVYLIAAVAAMLRPGKLGDAALFAALGFGALTTGNAIAAVMVHLRFMVASHPESIGSLRRTIGILSVWQQVLVVGGAVLVAIAVFAGRAKSDT